MARKSLAPALGQHVVRPVFVPNATPANRGNDARESSEVFHAVITERAPGLGLSKPTKGNETQRQW